VSSITTYQGIVHFEVYGRGRLIILLHGWLGSWVLWQETMAYLEAFYRIIVNPTHWKPMQAGILRACIELLMKAEQFIRFDDAILFFKYAQRISGSNRFKSLMSVLPLLFYKNRQSEILILL
jgi:pimeloyl-ACP methyl ester carboxylesterase